MPRVLVAVVTLFAACGLAVPTAGAATHHVTKFTNCTAMHKKYAHGVGRHGAHDRTKGKPVTNFYRNNALYAANKKSDRDKDGIACEKA